MPDQVETDEVLERLRHVPRASLIAIDGLPCSGKSTLAERITAAYGFECVSLDEFVRPEKDWPEPRVPAFPFEYVRYEAFAHAIRNLVANGQCSYSPFDWDRLAASAVVRTVNLDAPVIVEGVSTLNPVLCPLYRLKIFVDSDRASALQAAETRGMGQWADEWRTLFMPSVDIYMASRPELRADVIVRGRGPL